MGLASDLATVNDREPMTKALRITGTSSGSSELTFDAADLAALARAVAPYVAAMQTPRPVDQPVTLPPGRIRRGARAAWRRAVALATGVSS